LRIAPGLSVTLLLFLLLGNAACAPNAATPAPAIDSDRLSPTVSQSLQASPTGTVQTLTNAAIAVVDFQFQPAFIRVVRGGEITWTNRGSTAHRVVADDGRFDTGQIEPGKSVRLKLDQAGTLAYHCAIHPAMRATIDVR
jgi:plastocyanin